MSRKRGQGEGSIYKRKDGLWTAQVTVEGKHISKYFKTQQDARLWLLTTNSQIRDGLNLSGANISCDKYLNNWLITIKSTIRPKTHEQYTQIVQQHILPFLGEIKLKDLRPDNIQSLYNKKLKDGTSERTVILIHSVLHRALNLAVKGELLGRNPSDAVTRPRFRRKEMKTLDDTQVRSLIMASKGTKYETQFWLAVTTGLREGELIGLKWSDLDWKTGKLQIQRQVQRTKEYGLVFCEPKSASGRRVVVLGKATIEMLRKHFDLQQTERQFAGAKWKENNLIFPTSVGTPMEASNLVKHFKEYLKKANLPDIRFHDLRHTAASLMLLQGVHPKIVQERLGHSDIGITLNLYSHVLPGMQEDAAEKLDELISSVDISDEIKKISEKTEIYVAQK
jgi:integrase